MKAKLLNISLLVLLIFIVTKSYAGMGSENYGMEDSVFSNGGGPMASESFGVDSTLGQPSPLMEEEQPTSTNYAHYPGFWFTSNTPLVVTHNCQSIEFSRNCFLTEFGDRYGEFILISLLLGLRFGKAMTLGVPDLIPEPLICN
ncbi:MAG: hypothetical protein NTV89_18225 [Proteobacteria bacterium]|nr:hypothetical protein [Pseudomonadota bacterium]